ncbi:hypothetical protein D3C84_845370 [compost metagenome]
MCDTCCLLPIEKIFHSSKAKGLISLLVDVNAFLQKVIMSAVTFLGVSKISDAGAFVL